MTILVILIVMGFTVGVLSYRPSALASYYDILLDHCEQLKSNPNFEDWSNVKVKRVNKTRTLNGYILFNRTYGDQIITKMEFHVKRGGDYQLMPYRMEEKPFCQFFREDDYFYKDLAVNSDFPINPVTGCPLKPGKYSLRSVDFDFEKVPKTLLIAGEYAVDLIHLFEGEEVLKFRFFGSVVTA